MLGGCSERLDLPNLNLVHSLRLYPFPHHPMASSSSIPHQSPHHVAADDGQLQCGRVLEVLMVELSCEIIRDGEEEDAAAAATEASGI